MDPVDAGFWHLIAGTRGGPTRLGILLALLEGPLNANQICEIMSMDYKTVRHHLDILEKNHLLEVSKEKKYGEQYALREFVREKLSKMNLGKL